MTDEPQTGRARRLQAVDQGLGGGDTFEFEAVFGSDDDSDSFRL